MQGTCHCSSLTVSINLVLTKFLWNRFFFFFLLLLCFTQDTEAQKTYLSHITQGEDGRTEVQTESYLMDSRGQSAQQCALLTVASHALDVDFPLSAFPVAVKCAWTLLVTEISLPYLVADSFLDSPKFKNWEFSSSWKLHFYVFLVVTFTKYSLLKTKIREYVKVLLNLILRLHHSYGL